MTHFFWVMTDRKSNTSCRDNPTYSLYALIILWSLALPTGGQASHVIDGPTDTGIYKFWVQSTQLTPESTPPPPPTISEKSSWRSARENLPSIFSFLQILFIFVNVLITFNKATRTLTPIDLSMLKIWYTDFVLNERNWATKYFFYICLLMNSPQDLSLNILTIFKVVFQFLEIFDFENWKIHLPELSNSKSTLYTIRGVIKQELRYKRFWEPHLSPGWSNK